MNQTNCTTPRCSATARWRVAGTDRVVCGEHIPDSTPVEAIPDDTILAARCPPGWRRDPLNGRPVMPCLGRLLFPCQPDEVPTRSEITKQVWQVKFEPPIEPLVMSVLHSAALAKRKHDECMHLSDERAVSNAVDAALRAQGTVRIRRTAAGWEEVPDAAIIFPQPPVSGAGKQGENGK